MDLSIFTQNNFFLMLALDHRQSFLNLIVNNQDPIQIKKQIIKSLSNQFSGILLDTQFGLPAYNSLNISQPYLLAIEKSGFIENNGDRIIEIEHQVIDLKNMGASGIKLLIYFNSQSKTAVNQLETAKKVFTDCRQNNLPLFLEIVTYNVGDDSNQVYQSVKMFLDNDIVIDVFKLEYPGSPENCQKITKLLGDTPWILLTKSNDFSIFSSQLKIAITGGCRGFLAGRALWQEYPKMTNPQDQLEFITNTLPQRFKEITKIVLSS